ncbi:MAG TPA: phosphoribosylanthranilate isomerase [Candidatus Marinimicrobia bacterium]|nr:phosphoribosylanthranilate isomerase [Candidatus Neomarinimicrobiota bacterium]
MIHVKICGITSFNDAIMATNYGASALGFIFYEKSPRYINPEILKTWISNVPSSIKKVGVFVNKDVDKVNKIAEELNLGMVQLHGDESPEYCNQMIRPVIKVFRVNKKFDSIMLKNYQVATFLFDTYNKENHGGTGESFDWQSILQLNTETPVILSGGLNADNVLEGIEVVKPSAVDVNSGVETAPGKKDEEKIKNLFTILKNTKGNIEIF